MYFGASANTESTILFTRLSSSLSFDKDGSTNKVIHAKLMEIYGGRATEPAGPKRIGSLKQGFGWFARGVLGDVDFETISNRVLEVASALSLFSA